MSVKNKVESFKKELSNQGEMFFSFGSNKKDYEYIQSILDRQGYWSGTFNRLYFDDNLNLTAVESRF